MYYIFDLTTITAEELDLLINKYIQYATSDSKEYAKKSRTMVIKANNQLWFNTVPINRVLRNNSHLSLVILNFQELKIQLFKTYLH